MSKATQNIPWPVPQGAVCSVMAKYYGELPIILDSNNKPVADRLQLATEWAINTLLGADKAAELAQPVMVCVTKDSLELHCKTHQLLSCPLKMIAFCGRGKMQCQCFAVVRRDQNALLALTFECENKSHSSNALHTLAAAFGAMLKTEANENIPPNPGSRSRSPSPTSRTSSDSALMDSFLSPEVDPRATPLMSAELLNANSPITPIPPRLRMSVEDVDNGTLELSTNDTPSDKLLSTLSGQNIQDLSPARLIMTPQSRLAPRRKTATPLTKSATGCLICAQYVGNVGESALPKINYKDNQAKADAAVGILYQQLVEGSLIQKDVVLVVRTEVLEILEDATPMDSIPRQNIKSASQGQTHASFFVIGAKRNKNFSYHIFCVDDAMLAWASVEALARAFGAKDTDTPLLAPSPGMRRKKGVNRQPSSIVTTHVEYLGFMDTVGSNYKDAMIQCIKCQRRRVLPAKAQMQVKSHVIEFYDPGGASTTPSKWFNVEDIDCLVQDKNSLGILISRGNWREVRHCCYVLSTDTEENTTELCQKLVDTCGKHRDRIVKKALTGVLSYVTAMFEGNSVERNLMQLQQELDMLSEPHRTGVIWRLKAQRMHCTTDQDKMTAILSLFARLYGTTKLTPNRKAISSGSKPKRSLTGNLAASWESLLGRKGTKGRSTPPSMHTSENSRVPRSQTAPADGHGSAESDESDARSNKWRQDLYRSVAVKPPRKVTPGRRQSSAAILDLPKTPGRRSLTVPPRVRRQSSMVLLKLGPRKELVRARWQKAVQQQLLLIRMAKANEQFQKLSPTKEKEYRTSQIVDEKWTALFALPVDDWKEDQIRECLATGVPPQRRREYWLSMGKWLAKNCEEGLLEPYSYVDLLVEPSIYWHAIKIDVDRAFPERPLFQESGGGQKRLFNIMKAYGNYDVETGYCQGLHFVAGTFLMQLTEEEAFGVLVPLMYHHGIRDQYMHDMSILKVQLYQFSRLIADHLPSLFVHFQNNSVEPFFYAAAWFLSLFSSTFPEEFAAAVFDQCLLDGMMVVFKVGLALLSIHESIVLSDCADLEDTLRYFEKKLCFTPIDEVMSKALKLDISSTKLAQYGAEFNVMEDTVIVDIDQSVNLEEKVVQLTEKLMDSERIRLELDRELDLCKQQLNHAKSALQGLTLQNISNEEELESLKKALKAFSEA